jgi:flavin-dependent dehydrogenase
VDYDVVVVGGGQAGCRQPSPQTARRRKWRAELSVVLEKGSQANAHILSGGHG